MRELSVTLVEHLQFIDAYVRQHRRVCAPAFIDDNVTKKCLRVASDSQPEHMYLTNKSVKTGYQKLLKL